ncbi:MAG: helix-hairpin-helix domain-containing protein, partial [Clostridia bacterium]
KRKYRSFNIREKTQNDYAAMREAIDRRLKHVDGDWLYPDLILLDGGANHVSVIKQLLDERKIILPVFGMIKDEHHKTRTLTDGENEISLTARDDLFRFFYKIQEEVHNISFEKMDAKRRKSVKSTSLTDIDGVGQKTAELLLKYFGGLKKIKNASLEELIAIDGISRKTAENIYLFYKK